MLAPMSPPISPACSVERKLSQRHSLEIDTTRSTSEDSLSLQDFGHGHGLLNPGARTWSKLYQECVLDPSHDRLSPNASRSRFSGQRVSRSPSEIGPMDAASVHRRSTEEIRQVAANHEAVRQKGEVWRV